MNNELKSIYMSDIFGEDYLKDFDKVDYAFIQSQTGAGKTTFLLNRLAVDAVHEGSTLLYLVPRTILKKQIMEVVRQIGAGNPSVAKLFADRFRLMTYHEWAARLAEDRAKEFDYVICDEAHAIICESTFAANVYQPVYDWLVKQSGIKILVSATIEPIFDFMKEEQNLTEVKQW